MRRTEQWGQAFSPEGRIIGLDVLRVVAIGIVVFVHGALLVPKAERSAYLAWMPLKIDGVSVFFVLSGFLIGGILIRTLSAGPSDWKAWRQFLLRRWFRTLPNYLLVLTFLVLYGLVLKPASLKNFSIAYYAFAQNLTQPHPYFFPEAWSLAVEEWFYLLFPLACWAVARWRGLGADAIGWPALVFLVVPLIGRFAEYTPGMDPEAFDRGIRKVVVMRLDALMFGVLAAYAQVRWTDIWRRMRWPGGLLGSALLVLFYVNPSDWKGAWPPLLFVWESLAVVAFLPLLSGWKATGFRGLDRGIVFFSVVSYSLYLLHLTPVLHTLMPHVGADSGSVAGALGFYVGVSVLASAVLYLGFERPTTAWRERWAPHESQRFSPPAPGPPPVP